MWDAAGTAAGLRVRTSLPFATRYTRIHPSEPPPVQSPFLPLSAALLGTLVCSIVRKLLDCIHLGN